MSFVNDGEGPSLGPGKCLLWNVVLRRVVRVGYESNRSRHVSIRPKHPEFQLSCVFKNITNLASTFNFYSALPSFGFFNEVI